MAIYYDRLFNMPALTANWGPPTASGMQWKTHPSYGTGVAGGGALASGSLAFGIYVDDGYEAINTIAYARRQGSLSSGILTFFGKSNGARRVIISRNGVQIYDVILTGVWARYSCPYDGGVDVEFMFEMEADYEWDDGSCTVSDIMWVEDGSKSFFEDFSSVPAGQLTTSGVLSGSGILWSTLDHSPARIEEDVTRANSGTKTLLLKCLVAETNADPDFPCDNRIAIANMGAMSSGRMYIFSRNKGLYYPPPTFTDIFVNNQLVGTIKTNKKWYNMASFLFTGGPSVEIKFEERFQGQQGNVYLDTLLFLEGP